MTWALKRFLILLAVGLSLTASGQGTIAYYDPADIPVFSLSIYNYNFDLNGDGVTDFVLRARDGEFMAIPAGQNAVLGTPAPPPNLVGAVGALGIGYAIGLNLISPRQWIQGAGDADLLGRYGPVFAYEWRGANTISYMGVQFSIGSEIHYGWVQIWAYPNGGWIREWAYDTVAGQGILAGAVPEPSAWVFLLLGLGGFVFSRCRGRLT